MYDFEKDWDTDKEPPMALFPVETGIYFFAVGFLMIGGLVSFIETFYIQSNDWFRVLGAPALISLAWGVTGGIMVKAQHIIFPNTESPIYRHFGVFLKLSFKLLVIFIAASVFAVCVFIFAAPIFIFVSHDMNDQIDWSWALHWAIIVSYIIGGACSIIAGQLEFREWGL